MSRKKGSLNKKTIIKREWAEKAAKALADEFNKMLYRQYNSKK